MKPEFWPDWLVKFEKLANIEKIVIDQHVRKICPDRGSNFGAQDFLDGAKREKFQEDFRLEMDKACKENNVIIRSAFIRNIIIPETFLEQKRMERSVFSRLSFGRPRMMGSTIHPSPVGTSRVNEIAWHSTQVPPSRSSKRQ